MKVLVYSNHGYDETALKQVSDEKCQLVFTNEKLGPETAHLANGYQAVSLFTSDNASARVIEQLAANGVRYIALRSVGYDHVDIAKAKELGIRAANVPEYSPFAIAEHAVAMMMAVNRKVIEGRLLMQLQDFRVETLMGFDVHGKTVGIIGTGKIGLAFANIMKGFGTEILAFDPVRSTEALSLGVTYVTLPHLLAASDIVSIHCPLNPTTKGMLSKAQFQLIKKGAVLINTARGGVIKTPDLIDAIESGILKAVCLDVYENEKGLFFEDHRADVLVDPLFARLRSFKNVLITGHQAFLTNEAIAGIAKVTMANLNSWEKGARSPNELTIQNTDSNNRATVLKVTHSKL